ncbi:hypothetical protein [Chryseobacterium sp. MP_3.2]|uniref:hypothetical protein n=1 Tax=Chryseobacterium sp. MP_3.2 TaxID=3071712 RepID=UPI002E045DDC|nr:hypothetical protein [Chryseobacterium sp. MP_3.2]
METQYYRNNLDLQTLFDYIEADSLWTRNEDMMILVDEDRHAEYPYSPTMFREVPNP